MSLKNYLIKIPAGGFEKIVLPPSDFMLLKRTNATVPIIRVTYDGGSNRLLEFKANHKFTSEKDFTEIEIDNSNGAVALDMLFAIGKGSYDQSESNVTVTNGVENPVYTREIIKSSEFSEPLVINLAVNAEVSNLENPSRVETIVQVDASSAGTLFIRSFGKVTDAIEVIAGGSFVVEDVGRITVRARGGVVTGRIVEKVQI